MVVDVRKDEVVLKEGCRCACGLAEVAMVEGRVTNIFGVAEVSGVAEVVAGRDGGGVGGRQGGKQRVAVHKVDAAFAKCGKRRGVDGVYGAVAQTVSDEDDDIAW